MSSAPILDEVYVHEDDTSDTKHALVESSTPSHDDSCTF